MNKLNNSEYNNRIGDVVNYWSELSNNKKYNKMKSILIIVQDGKDAITGLTLNLDEPKLIEAHHTTPRSQGGQDTVENLILVDGAVHDMIHDTNENTFLKHLKNLNEVKQRALVRNIEKMNEFRKLAGNEEIELPEEVLNMVKKKKKNKKKKNKDQKTIINITGQTINVYNNCKVVIQG